VEAGISRVVVASDDPTPKASGRGLGILRDEGVGVDVVDGAVGSAARLLNQPFRKHARTGRPLVTLKAALSADGFTATEAGESKWISGPDSRALVHSWRAESDAVAVGIGTVLADDPLLTARDTDLASVRQPQRVVFDTAARLPLGSRLLGSLAEAPLVVITAAGAPAERVGALREAGAAVIEVSGDPAARVEAALGELGDRGITSLMVEGGAGLAGAFGNAGELDQLRLFIAPLLLGRGRPLMTGPAATSVAGAQRPVATSWEQHGDDILLTAHLREW
jgi:diaminohydroxyphosphoribosylaminopyrimidine deaminase/5-amino-6-(5-phosphoribosylamino)uracil reductase